MSEPTGVMISRAITQVPKDDKDFKKWVEKYLRQQNQDIRTLFAQCTDNDMREKLQRDNSEL